mmetsp:Transcript_42610/g.49803  ORF Transcript_42610/g.49803 Transcript_42610/m.49803 type:complete len:84 (+) Transcript_42610:121-372(+)
MQSEDCKSLRILRTKLKEWFEYEKDGELPSYAVFALLNIISKEDELNEDPIFNQSIREFIVKQNPQVVKEDSMCAALNACISE